MSAVYLLAFAAVVSAAAPDGFVPIKGGSLGPHRIDAFEMCERPVTNAEWKKYVDGTGDRGWTISRVSRDVARYAA